MPTQTRIDTSHVINIELNALKSSLTLDEAKEKLKEMETEVYYNLLHFDLYLTLLF